MLKARRRLVRRLEREGIRDAAVLAAMGTVPRHRFLPPELRSDAYANHPLPIGHGQTISQPYIVALMTESLQVHPGDRILEIGTGCGYQAAILAALGTRVFSVEIVAELADTARETLAEIGYGQVRQRVGDGNLGWPEHAPYDAIIVTAAPARTPAALLAQLRPEAPLLIPLGSQATHQTLTLLRRDAAGEVTSELVAPVRFVPLVSRQSPGTETP